MRVHPAYVSTRAAGASGKSGKSFLDILLAGAAEDGGLYMPDCWPQFTHEEMAALRDKPFAHVAFEILSQFTGDAFSSEDLRRFCDTAYGRFRHADVCPLHPFGAQNYLLELHHGPTFAFKDVAMQMLAQMVGAHLQNTKTFVNIICATSGDTGAAAVGAFANMPNANVIVLFPEGRISDVQRRQMTASGAQNVLALSVQGDFDAAQNIVKALFANKPFAQKHALTAVNSINFARIAAQITYFFTAALKLGLPDNLSFCVPTGNFGDIFAGYAAKKMGLPIRRLIIATNNNDILARALHTGIYQTHNVIPTTSPSMDIQLSSNFERLLFEASDRDAALVDKLMASLKSEGCFEIPLPLLQRIRSDFSASSANEAEVKHKISAFHNAHGVLIDPHTAVGLVAADQSANDAEICVTLSTAHPAKFSDAVSAATGFDVPMPQALAAMTAGDENFITVPAQVEAVQREIDVFQNQGAL